MSRNDELLFRIHREKLETLNGDRGDPLMHALRRVEINSVQELIAALGATADQINADLATAQGDIATLNDGLHPFQFDMDFTGTPIGGEVLRTVYVTSDITISANMAGSVGGISVNPSAGFTIDVKDDAVSIGTVTISTSGVVTFATSGGGSKTVSSGSKVTFVAQAVADAAISDIYVAIKGSIS